MTEKLDRADVRVTILRQDSIEAVRDSSTSFALLTSLSKTTDKVAALSNRARLVEDGTISEFHIDTATGQLSFVASIPTSSTAGLIIGQALHPTNEFLYVADAAAEVFGFDIGDGSFSGRLLGPNSTVPEVNGPAEAAIDPAGQCLYVTNFGDTADSVSRYSINEHNGVATSLGSTPTGENPLGIAIAPVLGSVSRHRQSRRTKRDLLYGDGVGLGAMHAHACNYAGSAVGRRRSATPEFVAFDPSILASSEGGTGTSPST